jgi:diguanylate cyclase (GGDEF)-like protein
MNSTESTDLLSTVVQHYPDGILVLDHARQIILMNNSATNMFDSAGVNLRLGEVFPFPVDHGFDAEIPFNRIDDDGQMYFGLTANVASFQGEPLMLVAVKDITDKINLQEELKTEALRDSLTQLYNRKGFTSLAEHQLLVAQREQSSLTVIFLDLDGLKLINDTYGHLEGDRAIADFAELLSKSVRKSDIVARLGGDEFAIIVLGNQALAAESVLIRLTTHIHNFNNSKTRPYTLSVSFGSARYSHLTHCPLSDLLERADENMYENKRARKLTQWAASCANIGQRKYAS